LADVEQLIADCRAALDGVHDARNVREVIARVVADPQGLMARLGDPEATGIRTLHRSDDLTVLDVRWLPHMVLLPHDHAMWAVIGIYTGREDNILWRRLPTGGGEGIEAAGAKSLATGQTIAFGPEVIHSVVNPLNRVTGALHVYGGDFFAKPRSEWDPETLSERPRNLDQITRQFER